jgi:putative intracellular protease/amidase
MKRKAFLLSLLMLLLAGISPVQALAAGKEILMIVTSADRMTSGKPTGLWLEEFAVPYQLFRAAGFNVTVASPKGGAAPVDPRSLTDAAKVRQWESPAAVLRTTIPLAQVKADQYVAIFLPGGHGTMFDLPGNRHLKELLQQFLAANKVVAAVCHGPSGFVGAVGKDGKPLVAGKTITAFTDNEERAVALDKEMPFLLESKLRGEGAKFVVGEKWKSHVEVDGKLVTGQNPASSAATAEAVINQLR